MTTKKPHVDPDTGTIRRAVVHVNHGPSLTEQHHAPACDVNNILARYTKTGVLEHVRQYEGQYTDCPSATYHEAMNRVTAVQSMFAELPSQLRSHFRNDPAEFVEFCEQSADPGGDLEKLGEEYRSRALGLPPEGVGSDATPPPGKAEMSAETQDGGMDPPVRDGEDKPF